MSYTLKGKVKVVGEVQQISDSFKKREFVITDESDQYPQDILFQAVQDRTGLLDNVKVGDSVEVSFNLRGREWTSPKDGVVKYFNSLDAWKIESQGGGTAPPDPNNPDFDKALGF